MFAENDRISHRQLLRQIVLSMVAPFLLCLTSWGSIRGINGLLGLLIALIFLSFYGIFLVRLAPCYEGIGKHSGKLSMGIIGILYGVYLVFTGAYLLNFVSHLIGTYLLTGVNEIYIQLAVSVVCVAGSHKGLQKRARMGEVSYWIIVGALILLLVLAAVQGQLYSLNELTKEMVTPSQIVEATYGVLCGFLPFTLLPFLLPQVKKSSSSVKTLWCATGILGGFLVAVLVFSPLILGWNRMIAEKNPVLPLLMGTNLPGDILARFDVIWIALLIYGFLYSLGSVFYYGNHIFRGFSLPMNRWVWWLLVLIISFNPLSKYEIQQYYGSFLRLYAGPILFLLTIYLYFSWRRKGS